MPKAPSVLVVLIPLLLVACGPAGEPPADAGPGASAVDPAALVTGTVASADGLSLVYDVRGPESDVTLVFVHCWSCNREFWREQVDVFAETHRVVTLDLGGHGESGADRDPWSIADLGADVKAVADELGLERMILVGHSMGGPVSLAAAALMPGRVAGIIAVDTLQDADFEFPEEMASAFVAQFEADFAGTMTGMFSGMMTRVEPELSAWVLERALAARPEVATALLRDFNNLDNPALFSAAGAPIRAINAAPTPSAPYATNVEGNRKYADFDAVIMEDVGHFLQLEKPAEFNGHLRRYVEELSASAG